MQFVRLAAIAALPLLLAACGSGGTPPAPAQPSSSGSAAPAAVTTPVAAPASDKALEPLFGTWGLDPANCGDQVLKISKTRFDGPGSGCEISGFTDNGDGTFTAAMSCTANGATAQENIQMRPIFAPTGEGIDLTYLNRDNQQSEVLRCEAD